MNAKLLVAPTVSAAQAIAALQSNVEAGLSNADAIGRLATQGPNEVAEERGHPVVRFAKKFWGLSAWMIELIAVLSIVLHKRADVWIALGLLIVNAVLATFQEQRASSAVAALRRRLQVTARVLRDRIWHGVPARELVTGDVVRVRAGDFVPADVQLLGGSLRVDQAALTGESRDVDRKLDDLIYSGSTVRDGEATGVVLATGVRTLFGRTTELVQGARPKLHVEAVISRVVRWLLVIVGGLACVTFVAAVVEGQRIVEIIPIALVLLMSAVPVALPVMFTVTMAVGSMELGRRGVLITRLGAIEDAANMDVLCADKTGTLTFDKVSLTGALAQPGFTEDDVVRAGALASNAANEDPIDVAFLRAATARKLDGDPVTPVSFVPFSAKTRRTEAVVTIAGRTIRVVKGALRTVAEAAGLDPAAIATLERRATVEASKGVRVLAVARADGDTPLRLCGLAMLYDAPRPESRVLIDELRGLGIHVEMLTGDALPVAQEIARMLGLGAIERVPDLRATPRGDLAVGGFAEVFPEDKFLVVQQLQAAGHVVGMTGDGVNDAPALRQKPRSASRSAAPAPMSRRARRARC